MGKKTQIEPCIECDARMEEILKTFPGHSAKDSKRSKRKDAPTSCVIKKSKPAK